MDVLSKESVDSLSYEEAEKLVKNLSNRLKKLNKNYYNENKSLVEDFDYDQMLRKLETLERKFPKLRSANSPTQTIGYAPSKNFPPFKHPLPMLSLANAMDFDEVEDFLYNIKKNLGILSDLKTAIGDFKKLLKNSKASLIDMRDILKKVAEAKEEVSPEYRSNVEEMERDLFSTKEMKEIVKPSEESLKTTASIIKSITPSKEGLKTTLSIIKNTTRLHENLASVTKNLTPAEKLQINIFFGKEISKSAQMQAEIEAELAEIEAELAQRKINWAQIEAKFAQTKIKLARMEKELMIVKINLAQTEAEIYKNLTSQNPFSSKTKNDEAIKTRSDLLKKLNELQDNLSKLKPLFLKVSEEIKKAKEYEKINLVATPKIDGLALELVYQNGKLHVAATRGDGIVGENVTRNALEIKGVLPVIKSQDQTTCNLVKKSHFVVRGEVIITKQTFQKINDELAAAGEKIASSPRNFVSGTLRQLNSAVVAKRQLLFLAYSVDFLPTDGKNLVLDYHEQIDFLRKCQFKIVEPLSHVNNFDAIKNYCEQLDAKREELSIEIDGAVLRIDRKDYQKKLGVAGRKPRWAIAWKLPPKETTTVIEDVLFQVGRTGVITPVAKVKPTALSGAIISRVTLNNAEEIKKKDLRLGDHVVIIRSGGVIPKLLRVKDPSKRTGKEKPIVFPKNCPSCGEPLKKNASLNLDYCTNEKCPSRFLQEVIHFVSKPALNIENLGPGIIEELIKKNRIKKLSDIFFLKKEDLFIENHSKEKNAEKLLQSINLAKKKVPLRKLIYALGILGVGEQLATILERKYKNIENLFHITDEELQELGGIGKEIGRAISAYFQKKSNQQDIERMIDLGLEILPYQEPVSGNLKNEYVAFTGKLKNPRHIFSKRVQDAGATIMASPNKKTTLLVVGENPTARKVETAKNLNIKIIDEKELESILEQ